MTVGFAAIRPLERAENIKAVWDKYDGEKEFIRREHSRDFIKDVLNSKKFDLIVTDDYLPGCKYPMIMISHGLACGKTYGLLQPNAYHIREDNDNYIAFTTSSEHVVGWIAKQCGVTEDKVLPIGMPRTDAYIGKKKGDGGTPYGEITTYLYAPTFGTLTQDLTVWSAIDDMLTDNEVLLVKNHPVTGDKKIHNEYMFRHIKRISCDEISTPYLLDCDVLITDYSSIMFDAYICNKPVVLYEKDWGTYKERRGMTLNYPDEYSSRHATTGYAMVKLCREAVGHFEDDPICVYNKEYLAGACDGHSTDRLIELIKKELKKKNELRTVRQREVSKRTFNETGRNEIRSGIPDKTDNRTPRYSTKSESDVRPERSTDGRNTTTTEGLRSEVLREE